MPFKAETYRVFIASPSDLIEEREIATLAIEQWNQQHAVDEATVLLPVKWETHARPQSGIRGQEAINKQLVRNCDLLVGMFWTKFGFKTKVAAAATVEEIDLFVKQHKPALIYFSRRPVDPIDLDATQIKRLKNFKRETYKNAFVGTFASLDQLRETLMRDLLRQVRDLKARKHKVRGDKLNEAMQVTELLRKHRRYRITSTQFEEFRTLLGLTKQPNGSIAALAKGKKEPDNPVKGLFFDYSALVAASIMSDERDQGWYCTIEIAGENYETKQFEVIGISVNKNFKTEKAAIQHGKRIITSFGVECLDVRSEEL